MAIAITARSSSLVLVLIQKSQDAQQRVNDLHFYLGQEHHLDEEGEADGPAEIQMYTDWETLPYDSFSPHEDITSERLKALSQLDDLRRGLLILPVQTLAHRLPPREHLDGQRFVLKVGDEFDIHRERRRLEASGYHSVDTVREHGEFAVRGAILDVFPMGSNQPLRVELFDTESKAYGHSIRTPNGPSPKSSRLPSYRHAKSPNRSGIACFRRTARDLRG